MSRVEPHEVRALRERKRSHLDLCRDAAVEYPAQTTLFEDAELIHNALPELALDEIDVGVDFVGKRLRAPLLITGMTGGTADAFAVNRDLALVAEQCGIAFGLGSQRVMQRDPSTAWTFAVREFAVRFSSPASLRIANRDQRILAGQEGIEPPTPGFGDRCSAN